MAETSKKPNLYQKILSITGEIGKMDKTGKNTMQGYAFIEQAQVVAEIRVQLVKHGVAIIPETISRTIERFPNAKGTITVHANVVSRYTLVNTDDPSDRMVCDWDAGEALDTSDKATNKAVTASDKSFLLKLFNISDKDDPDAGSPVIPPKPTVADPSEPSRQVTDEPISNMSKEKVRHALAVKKYHGAEVTNFCQLTINKPAPTTEQDAVELLKALEG